MELRRGSKGGGRTWWCRVGPEGVWLNHRAARLLPAGAATGASPIWELICECPAEVAIARYAARIRHPAHLPPDDATLDRIRRAAHLLVPLGLGPVIRVDTSKPMDVMSIVARLTAHPTGLQA